MAQVRRKRRARPWPKLSDDGDPRGLVALVKAYLEHARTAQQMSESTLRVKEWHLNWFVLWCHDREVRRSVDVTRAIVERYQRHLFHFKKPDGRSLSIGFQRERLNSLRAFFRWATRRNLLLANPASELELPRKPQRLPRAVLTAHEVEQILAVPDLDAPEGLRDRALMEVLYATGIRRSEAAKLVLDDVDVERGSLMVRQGKYKKDRMLPLGERASAFVRKYLDDARPFLAVDDTVRAMFLRSDGLAFKPDQLTGIVTRYVKRAGITKSGACHMFRHTMATLMLEGGADIRFIQAMLGHSELTTTEVYTRVSILKLQAVHRATHPAATLARTSTASADLIADAGEPIVADDVGAFDEHAEEDDDDDIDDGEFIDVDLDDLDEDD
jgi:integrase/recombinase XerD